MIGLTPRQSQPLKDEELLPHPLGPREWSRQPMPSRAVDTPIGTLGLIGSEAGLSRVVWSAKGLPGASARARDHPPPQPDAYFAGELIEFDLPLDLDGTEFQQQCWLALAAPPPGQTHSARGQAPPPA